MTQSESANLEQLVAAYVAGETPDVPESQREEFDQAVAAHAALQGMIEETVPCGVVKSDERRPPELPDEYRIEREIGKGGMGVVYLAHQQSLNRDVALKVLRPGEQTFGPLVKRFLREAKHLARLRHPNIVSIHEIGDAQGEPYFTMDYIDGESLSAEIRRGPMSPTQALAMLKQVAEGVQHAHRQGIIHRDLKPSNVLIDHEGTAFVTDFGLARDVSQSSELTQTGELLGTPQYMAPEQARGQTSLIGEATDIHALGLLLLEMLTGRAAFVSSSPADVLVRLLNDDPPPLRSIDRRIPRDLETICQKTLQKSPAARYSSVSALLEDIRRFEAGEALVARRTSVLNRTARWMHRHWKIGTAVVVTALLVLVIAISTGPRLFDKTQEELIAWAEENHADGRHKEAVDVYWRAFEKAEGAQRNKILRRMVECCRKIRDAKELIAVAMPILEKSPEASFGEYDYLVAQAVYADIVERHPDLLASVTSDSAEDHASLEFAARRYNVFLNGGYGTQQERTDAEHQLQLIQQFTDQRRTQPASSRTHEGNTQLPQGSPGELLRLAEDASVGHWGRGKAAYAAGRALQDSQDREAALAAYHRALGMMRSVFPTYAGISTRIQRSQARGLELVEDSECGLLREVLESIQNLDPDYPAIFRGGIRFRIAGTQIPPELVIRLRVELRDHSLPALEGDDKALPRIVVVKGHEGWVGVADGRYRLSVRLAGTSATSGPSSRIASLLDFDLSAIPNNVELNGDSVECEISARLSSEIALTEPQKHATVDLRKDLFRWSAVENANHYKISFVRRENRVGEGRYYTAGETIRATTNSVCLAVLANDERRKAKWLKQGVTAVWHVYAFDSDGQRIGASLEADRSFLVGHGIEDNKQDR